MPRWRACFAAAAAVGYVSMAVVGVRAGGSTAVMKGCSSRSSTSGRCLEDCTDRTMSGAFLVAFE